MVCGFLVAVGVFVAAKLAFRACGYRRMRGQCGSYGHKRGGWGPSAFGAPNFGGGEWGHGGGGAASGYGDYRSSAGFAQWHGDGHSHHHNGGMPRHLHEVLARLDLSYAQTDTLRKAWRDVQDTGKSQRGELETAKREFAQAFRGESFDETALGNATSRLESAVDAARKTLIGVFASVHGALDMRQRGIVADYIEHVVGNSRGGYGRGF
jgi:uncharacterized membrane protein